MYQYRGLAFLKLSKILAQLRHVHAAERSHEAAVENEQHIRLAAEI